MNYLESSEYKDAKNLLTEEYKICFIKIETYLQFANIYGLQQEACLIQILDDFLSAQAEGKQIVNITGPDFKKYCDTMIHAEKSRNKSKLDVVAKFIGIPLIVMLSALLSALLPRDGNAGNLTNSITINTFSLTYPFLFLIYYIIKWSTAKALFHHAKASRIITTIVSMIALGFILTISKTLNNILNIAIPIPFPVFISVFTLLLSLLVVIGVIKNRNNKQLKIMPDREEEDTIDQVICPMCGKEYDLDYPKCPYCKKVRRE